MFDYYVKECISKHKQQGQVSFKPDYVHLA